MANILLLEDSSLVGFGGGQKMSLLVASILSKKHNLFFIDFTKDSTYLQKLKSDFPNAKVCYLKSIRGINQRIGMTALWRCFFNSLFNLYYLQRMIRENHIECLYATTRLTSIYCFFLHLILKVPFVYHAHLVQRRDIKSSWLWDWITYSASAVLCVSKRVMDSMSKGNKLLVYNSNLNYRGYKGEKKNTKWTVAFVGSLIEIKGVVYLIEAAKELPDVVFLIYGEGPLEADLKRLAPANVIFKGFCNDVITQLYNYVDIVVVPTIIEEALSLTAVDAKSIGLPVIVTNIGGQSEIVREGIDGIKVSVKSPFAIVKAIKDITSSYDRYNEMAYKSYESSKMFDLTEFKKIITKTFENY